MTAAAQPSTRVLSGVVVTEKNESVASGLDVLDLSLSKQIHHGVDFNVAIDNLSNKRYWETQNYFASRLATDPDPRGTEQIHATPGSPVGVTVGVTFRFGEK